jgi:hypothetical protein
MNGKITLSILVDFCLQGPTTSAADQAHVAELKQHMSETSASAKVTGSISDIPDVSIDSGIYKYVLIKVFGRHLGYTCSLNFLSIDALAN